MAEITLNTPPVSRKREVGIEILRLVCMFLIVCQHFLNHGGFMKNAADESFAVYLINVLFSPSVNVFVLISGYFSYRSTAIKPRKLASLYLQVAFYSILTPIAVGLFFDGVKVSLIKMLLPITSREYWFFSAYFLLMLVLPFINAMIGAISKRMHGYLLVGTLAAGYLASRFDIQSVLSLNSGYSFIWFVLLYTVGAYFGKYKPRIPKIYAFAIYLLTVITEMIFKYISVKELGFFGTLLRCTTDYNDPLTLIAAVCLVILFLDLGGDGRASRGISFASASTFGVYLLHEAPAVRSVLYSEIFHTERYFGRATSFLYVLLFALVTFVVGIATDMLRRLIFYGVGKLFSYLRSRMCKGADGAKDG